MKDLVYDAERNVLVYTGIVKTLGEQIQRFKDEYADYKNLSGWRLFLLLFMFKKEHEWQELIQSNEEFAIVVDKLHQKILRGKKQEINNLLDTLVALSDKQKEK